jgi:hypothetical protein
VHLLGSSDRTRSCSLDHSRHSRPGMHGRRCAVKSRKR